MAKLILTISLLLTSVVAYSQTRVAAVGDSITSGYPGRLEGNGCRCDSYVEYLEDLMDDNDWPSSVYNYGIAGDRANRAANRIPGIIEDVDPDYILFLVGTNDLFYHSPNTVRLRIDQAIRNIRAGDKIPIVGTLLPDTRGDNNDIKEIPYTNSLIRIVVEGRDVQLAEFYNATSFSNWRRLMPDGLHPADDGWRFMADIWYDALVEAREEAERRARIERGTIPIIQLLLLD